MKFIGRKYELSLLKPLAQKPKASLVVIRGRRRIGKSRLVEEAGKGYRFLRFSGIAPVDGVTAQDQRQTFSNQMSQQFNLPEMIFRDWETIFVFLQRFLTTEPTLVLFDEISWMGSKDPTFLPKLKNAWDNFFHTRQNFILVLCGSVSTWIEKNIIQSTAFLGRISRIITLEPLLLGECKDFLQTLGFRTSNYEIFKILSVTGGIPWYLEQLDSQLSADENIKQLCFMKDSSLFQEFDRIFEDIFSKRGHIYKKIMEELAKTTCDQASLRRALGYSHSGSLSKYLNDLILCGFVSMHQSWSLQTLHPGKQALYKIKDPFVMFHFRFIKPNIQKISQNLFEKPPLSQIPGWDGLIGLQVENLVIANIKRLYQDLKIPIEDIQASGLFYQKANATRKGCQIDTLIQLRTGVLYAVEIKFSRNVLGREVIDEVKRKLSNLNNPKNTVVSPILIHLNGVSDSVIDENFFYKIIDLNSWLREEENLESLTHSL